LSIIQMRWDARLQPKAQGAEGAGRARTLLGLDQSPIVPARSSYDVLYMQSPVAVAGSNRVSVGPKEVDYASD
jgi:hypothetical protein